MKTPDQLRKADLAKIHIAKQQLCMTDDDYRALIQRISRNRTDSAAGLNIRELGHVLAHMRKSGFKQRAPRLSSAAADRPQRAQHALARKLRAMWIYGYELGIIRDPSERAIAHFAARTTRASDLSFSTPAQLSAVIEAVKALVMRDLPAICQRMQASLLQSCDSQRACELHSAMAAAIAAPTDYNAWHAYHACLRVALSSQHQERRHVA